MGWLNKLDLRRLIKTYLMAKNKSQEAEDNEPLLTIKTVQQEQSPTNKIVETKAVDKSSVFTELKEEKPIEIIEKKPLAKTTQLVKKTQEQTTPISLVWEMTFVDLNNVENTVYTYEDPIFLQDGMVEVHSAFGKSDLAETILNQTTVQTSCKKNLQEENLTIDVKKGTLIKAIPAQSWMSRDFEATKKVFDEAVLDAYRKVSSEIKSKITQKEQVSKKVPNVVEEYGPGNIPVNRNIIQDL